MALAWLKKDLAGRFWRKGLQLEWAAAILPYATNSDFSYFATKWELCPIPYCRVLWQGDKALPKEWCDTHPPPLLFSQMLCRVLEHTSLVICVSKGLWEEKIQRKQKEFSIWCKYILPRVYSSPMIVSCSWKLQVIAQPLECLAWLAVSISFVIHLNRVHFYLGFIGILEEIRNFQIVVFPNHHVIQKDHCSFQKFNVLFTYCVKIYTACIIS